MEKDLSNRYKLLTRDIALQVRKLREDLKANPNDKEKQYLRLIGTAEFSNYHELLDYPSYLYMTGLLLTDAELFKKEHCDINSYLEKRVKYDGILTQAKPSKLDSAIYTIMQSQEGYEFLKYQISQIGRLYDEISLLSTTIDFEFDIPSIDGLENIKSNGNDLTLSEALELSETLKKSIKMLTNLKRAFQKHSPVELSKIMNARRNIIEKAHVLISKVDIDKDSPYFKRYVELTKIFNEQYPEYKKLKNISTLLPFMKARFYMLSNELTDKIDEIIRLVNDAFMQTYYEVITLCGIDGSNSADYFNENYPKYLESIESLLATLKLMLEVVNQNLDSLAEDKDAIKNKIASLMIEISHLAGIEIKDSSALLGADLKESYQNVHFYKLAKEMDKASRDEIMATYGKIAASYVYRIVPIN